MKNIMYRISVLTLCTIIIFSCGSDEGDDPSEMTDQQKAAKVLKDGSPWAIASVDSKPDGADAEALNGLQLSFGITGSGVDIAPGSFASSGVEGIESDHGASWSWDGTGISTISLSGGFVSELSGVQLTPGVDNATSIQVTFQLTSIGGRGKGLGEYTITLE
jgi:hypothetical protein